MTINQMELSIGTVNPAGKAGRLAVGKEQGGIIGNLLDAYQVKYKNFVLSVGECGDERNSHFKVISLSEDS